MLAYTPAARGSQASSLPGSRRADTRLRPSNEVWLTVQAEGLGWEPLQSRGVVRWFQPRHKYSCKYSRLVSAASVPVLLARRRCRRNRQQRVLVNCAPKAVAVKEAATEAKSDAAPKAKKEPIFPPHLRSSEIKRGLETGAYVQAKLRMERADVGSIEIGQESMFIVGAASLNRACDGDEVVVERLTSAHAAAFATPSGRHQVGSTSDDEDEDDKALRTAGLLSSYTGRTRGRVVSIVRRSRAEICGSLKPNDQEFSGPEELANAEEVIFIPSNEKFPYVILKLTDKLKNITTLEMNDLRLTVTIGAWDRFSQFPAGKLARIIGKAGEGAVETEMILMEYNVNNEPFSEEVLDCLPPEDYSVSPREIEGRTDFRNVCVCSIDPPGCEDVDDALSCELLPNGNYRVGVHIADVTHYVHPDSAIDAEAAARCESVYLKDLRVDMLPKLLTTHICSLRCDGKDRLTFSAVFELTPDAEVVKKEFCKSVIRSRAALSYAEAQDILDSNPDDSSELNTAIRNLSMLSQKLRSERMAAGAVTLDSEEIRFEIDPKTQLPTSILNYQKRSTNELIEEFMLLANRHVAHLISEKYGSALLRRHPPPKEQKMAQLVELLACHGIMDFKYKSSKDLADSLNLLENPNDPFFTKLVKVMTTRCMEAALYFCTGDLEEDKYYHFGLAMSHYTHFTSPIRRYADCWVHRYLDSAIHDLPLDMALQNRVSIGKQVEQLNYKHRNAQYAEWESTKMHLYLYFKARGAVETEATVIYIGKGVVSVAVQEFGTDGTLEISSQDWLILERKQRASGRPLSKYEGLVMVIFSRIVVRIEADVRDGRHRNLRYSFVRMVPKESEEESALTEKAPAA